MSKEGLDALRARVHEDAALARRFRRIEPERFVAEAVRIAAESEIAITEAELEGAIADGRRAWTMRWIE
jgi:hypothetical protein